MKYFASELHCHTRHSDGDFSVEELLEKAFESKLDIIALTDHNTESEFDELTNSLQERFLPIIKGIEWTTFFGHMLVLGCEEYVDWRLATPNNIDKFLIEIKNKGGIIGLAHPFDLGSPMCTGGAWEFLIQDYNLIDYIEVWHEDFPSVKTPNKRTKTFWLDLLDKGYRIPLVYGKDWHNDAFENNICGATYIATQGETITEKTAIEGISQGRTSITMAQKFVLEIEKDGKNYFVGDEVEKGKCVVKISTNESDRKEIWGKFNVVPKNITLFGENKSEIFKCKYNDEVQVEFISENKFIRAELFGSVDGVDCEIALTSPIYFKD